MCVCSCLCSGLYVCVGVIHPFAQWWKIVAWLIIINVFVCVCVREKHTELENFFFYYYASFDHLIILIVQYIFMSQSCFNILDKLLISHIIKY